MKTTEIRQKLHHYIETAEESKLKAIYILIEDEIGEIYDFWNDEGFIAELERREKAYLNGTAKTYTTEKSLIKARLALKNISTK